MSFQSEAVDQYQNALRQGKKYFNACMAKGVSPYPAVLKNILRSSATAAAQEMGIIDIPISRITGTWAEGRKAAFAGNFMPLIDINSEFGSKWVNLCASQFECGITTPIICYEYLGNFYVQEGHKRVSVMKSLGAFSILGQVTRLVPEPSDDPEVKLYYEFMDFYRCSSLYTVSFTLSGGYARLQAALGFEPGQVWDEAFRREFSGEFMRFSAEFERINTEKLPLTAADVLLTYLEIHPFAELRDMTNEELHRTLSAIWPDVRLLAQGSPISFSIQPETREKSLLERLLGSDRLHAAFIYDFDPATSPWASAHKQGENYLKDLNLDGVSVSSYLTHSDALKCMETAVAEGANVIFATTPTLIDACRRIAAEHKNVAVYNCSLSLAYAEVRGYYCRIYESKYIAGAIAGAVSRTDRIGYVANYPIVGSVCAINAFALGARLTNPRARVCLKWSCLEGNPVQELLESGADVISNRDRDGANSAVAWHQGTYQVENGEMRPLASPRWNWGVFYDKTIRALKSGGIEAARDRRRAINDWWGLSAGVVNVDLDESLPSGLKTLAEILKRGISSEQIDPFLCPITSQDGSLISDGTHVFTPDELMRMDWLNDNVEGRIPEFDELLPQSRNLVRLLGIHRDAIPPEAEESSL
ncbi:MAG: BMP family ABC transporter substrate-binding protein [Clostridiales bacterium]|nr:BMP family ABC transporter substrate-binding protein [Clostridiales bacterium]